MQVGDRRITYAELEAEANRLAHFLAARGSRARATTSASTPRTASSTWWRCSRSYKVRAVAINVNYRYVDEELHYMYDNADLVSVSCMTQSWPTRSSSGSAAKVDQPAPPARRSPGEGGLVVCDAPGAVRAGGGAGFAGARFRPAVRPDDLCIVYTGGTTGFPKGGTGATRTSGARSAAASTSSPAATRDEYAQAEMGNTPAAWCACAGPAHPRQRAMGRAHGAVRRRTVVLLPQFDPGSGQTVQRAR